LIGNWIKNDNELAIANTFSEKKIKNYNAKDMEKLVELMARWRLLLGATSEVSPDELTFICQFLYDNFKNLTIGDITIAMNWAISGRTDLGFVSQKTISSFYVSKAIQAYLDEKKRIIDSIAYEKQKHEEREQNGRKIEITPEEAANNFKDHVISVFRWWMENGYVNDFGDMVYNWLKKSGNLKSTPELINAALSYANDKYLKERQAESLKSIVIQTVDPKTEENRKKKLAREYVISQIFNETEITELIIKIKPIHFIKDN